MSHFRKSGYGAVFFLMIAFFCAGCSEDQSSDDTISAPEVLKGTASLSDTSATVYLTIGSSPSGALRAADDNTVSGTITYGTEDYAFEGTFDPETGAIDGTATGQTSSIVCEVTGFYSEEDGYSGTVTYNGVTVTLGTIAATATTASDAASVAIFFGEFAGPVTGKWNMTLTEDMAITGTYCGIYGSLTVGGTLTGKVNDDNTVTIDKSTTYYYMGGINEIKINLAATGTYNMTTGVLSGTWTSDSVAGMYDNSAGGESWTCTDATPAE
ncbi:MAG: hypothetical protein ACRCUT_02640 [Spirochaetota bacterium]